MRALSIIMVLGLASGAVSCGDEPPSSNSQPSTSQPRPTQPPTTEDPLIDPVPTPTGKRPNTTGATTTVTGVVAAGVEAGCLLLETGSETLLLLGVRPEDAREGLRVRVTGSRSPGTATTCQQGVPFRVNQIRPVDE